jgi:hypothetical protein
MLWIFLNYRERFSDPPPLFDKFKKGRKLKDLALTSGLEAMTGGGTGTAKGASSGLSVSGLPKASLTKISSSLAGIPSS